MQDCQNNQVQLLLILLSHRNLTKLYAANISKNILWKGEKMSRLKGVKIADSTIDNIVERLKNAKHPDFINNPSAPITGGIKLPTCSKCGTLLEQTTKGVIIYYCPKCKKTRSQFGPRIG